MASAPVTLNQTKPSYISAINADGVGSQGPVAIKKTPGFSDFQHTCQLSQEGITQNTIQMEGEVGDGLEDVIMQRRAGIQQAYDQLRGVHPLLPEQLRDFQVLHISTHLCLQKKKK